MECDENGRVLPFIIDELKIEPFEVEHGIIRAGLPYLLLGFRICDFVYMSDVSAIPPKSQEVIQDCRVLVVDALQPGAYLSHFSFSQAFESCKTTIIKGGRGYFTGLNHQVLHEDVELFIQNENLKLGDRSVNVFCAYDGLVIELNK
jgi:phosphoribosyl 1,2-cyclic phosphate phosphodiesterase